MLKALGACFDGVIDGVNFASLLDSGTNISGRFKPTAFSKFAIPFAINNSAIESISVTFSDDNIIVNLSGITIDSTLTQIPSEQGRKSFWLQDLLFRKLFGITKITIILSNVALRIESHVNLCLEEVNLCWSSGSLNVFVHGAKMTDGTHIIFEKERFEITHSEEIKCRIDELSVHILPEKVTTISKYIKILRSLFARRNVETIELGFESEEEQNEVSSIISESPSEAGPSFEILLDTVKVDIGNLECVFSSLKWNSTGIYVDKANIGYGQRCFSFERISYEPQGGKFHILKFSSNCVRQIQPHFPFLVTGQMKENSVCTIAQISVFCTLKELRSAMMGLTCLMSVLCNCFTSREGLVIQVPSVSLFLENGVTASFLVQASLKERVYQLGLEKAVICVGSSDPIVNKFSFQLSDDGKCVRVLVSPSDIRITFAELKLLIDESATVLGDLLPFHSEKSMQLSIVTTDIALCKEVNGTKHNYLFVSLNDIVMRAIPKENSIDVHFAVSVSVRYWNPLTSACDFIVQPFYVDIAISIQSMDIDINAKIGTPVFISLWPRFLNSMGQKSDERYGSQTVRVQNCLTKSIKILTHSEVKHKVKFSGSNPNLKQMSSMRRNSSRSLANGIKASEHSVIEIASGETVVLESSVSTPIELVDFGKSFRLNQVFFPVLIDSNVVITPVVENETKVLRIGHRYAFRNSLEKPLRLFLQADNSAYIEEIPPNGTFPIFLNEKDITFTFRMLNDSSFPEKWYKTSEIPCVVMTECACFAVSRCGNYAETVFEIRSLYYVRNDLPFPVICTFISLLVTSTIDMPPLTTQDVILGDDNATNFSFACCVHPLGISSSFDITRIPCIEKLSIDSLEFLMSVKRNEFGQFEFCLFGYAMIYNCLDRPISVQSNGKALHAVVVGDVGNRKPLFIPSTLKELRFAIDEDGEFIPFPSTTAHVHFPIGKENHFPVFIRITEAEDGRKTFQVKPVIMIHNQLDVDLVFRVNGKSFTVKASEERCPDFVNDMLAFSLAAELDENSLSNEIEMISLAAPTSTVFQLSDDMSQIHVHLHVDIVDEVLIATFKKAMIPYPFVITNQIENLPIFAQQMESSMPVRVEPNSTKFFAFDAPFEEPAIMLTIAGKPQLIPLHADIEGTILTRRFGPSKIHVDVLTLENGVMALVVGTQPQTGAKRPSVNFSITCDDLSVALLDSHLNELLLLTLNNFSFQCVKRCFDLSVGSFQVDDQKSGLYGVIMRNSKAHKGACLHCFLACNSNIWNIHEFSLVVQPIEFHVDDGLLSRLREFYGELSTVKRFIANFLTENEKNLMIQRFTIHPSTFEVRYWHIPKQRRSSGSSTSSPKCATLALGSLMATDMKVTPACVRHLLKTHYGHYFSLLVSTFFETAYTVKPIVSLSRFQCSALISEFYQDVGSEITPSEKVRVPVLAPIEVFPVNGVVTMALDYSNQTLINLWPQDSRMFETQRLVQRRRSQITYAFRITRMTQDEVTAELMMRSALKEANETDALLFIEYCAARQSIVCITTKHVFTYTLRTKHLADYRIANVSNIIRDGKRVQFQCAVQKKWRSSVVKTAIDFETEELAEHAHLIITSLALSLSM